MSTEDSRALVRRYFEEINNRNLAVLDDLLAPEYVDHTPLPFPVTPGRDGTREVAHSALRATPDGWHRIRAQVAEGGYVMTLIDAGGTFREALYDLQPTGEPITMSGMALHRVSGAKLVEHWGISDFAGLFQQIGLMPRPPHAEVAPPPPEPVRGGRAPTRDEAERIIGRFVEVLNRRDFGMADEIVAPDFRADFIGMPLMTDREAWKGMAQGFLGAFSDFRLVPEHGLYDGEWVAGHWTWSGTHTGELAGIPPTGRPVQVRGMGMYRILDGRIVEEHVIEDMMALLVQLGVAPPPPGQTVPA
ncbi:MAG TPA: ester cyclase [Chloroflexota bacterium]|nr:ester cyclase [Chloroflexota bacterium]